MVVRLLIAAGVMVLAVVVAAALRRRRASDPPTQPRFEPPSQIDRADFEGAGWLVAVFTSDTCSTCADVVRKAEVVRSDDVTVQVASYQARRDLHDRYRIDAVPLVLIAGPDGVVRASFVGPVSAADLWSAIADRD